MMSFLAVLLAAGLIYLLLPLYGQLVRSRLNSGFSVFLTGFLLGIGLITGLVAGTYPAFYLSSFNP
jgi:hypothetical protein